jgi:choline dehydrogenase
VLDHPLIDHDLLGDDDRHDRAVLARGVALARELLASERMAGLVGEELAGGPARGGDGDIAATIDHLVTTAGQAVGTCAMGEDAMSVVDDRGAVHGVDGVYVSDSSILPRSTRGAGVLATVVVATRIAESLSGVCTGCSGAARV